VFQANPQLKQYVRAALEKAVHELMPPVVERAIKIALTTCPVVERAIKIALTTCEQIIKKVQFSTCLVSSVHMMLQPNFVKTLDIGLKSACYYKKNQGQYFQNIKALKKLR